MMSSSGRKGRKKLDTASGNKLKPTPGPGASPGASPGAYIMDKSLAPRVKQYLCQFRRGYTPDMDEMTNHLQSRYGEYNRKKRNMFKLSVKKVYQSICRKQSEDTFLQNLEDSFLQKRKNSPSYMPFQNDESDSQDEVQGKSACTEQILDSSDSEPSLTNEPLVEVQDTNMMNQSMQLMYKVSTPRPSSEADDNEAIPGTPAGKLNKDKTDIIGTPPLHLQRNTSTPASTMSSKENTTKQMITRSDERKEHSIASGIIHSGSEWNSLLEKSLEQSDLSTKRKLNDASEKTNSPSKRSRKRKKEGNSKEDTERLAKTTEFATSQSMVKFSDIGGCEETIEQVCKMMVHMRHPEVFTTLGVTPTRGFLLHGPPGCGKTLLAHAIAGELGMPFIKLAATEIVSGVSGESEEKVRDLFGSAVTQAPCVLFIDEIDAITPKRENASKDMERRIVSQLLTCMDDLNNNPSAQVLVIGATNRLDSLDPALRRAGRFDREISMGIPNEKSRERVLRVLCKQLKLSEEFSFAVLARKTPGYVGADLMALTREAAMVAINRVFTNLENNARPKVPDVVPSSGCGDNAMADQSSCVCTSEVTTEIQPERPEPLNVMEWLKEQPPLSEDELVRLCISMEDFTEALSLVQPSAKREGFVTIPDVTWEDIGALKDVREELTMAILAPVQHPEEFLALGLTHPPGILLAGPPGCGKTLLAKAIANESGINFISVKGPELLNMYVGESERAVRQVFQRARNSSPCVIFFDELDALCPRRSDSSESGVSVRVVNQLLTEMDGLQARKHVFIMAATNRPDIIDPAVLRPGRLDKVLYVGLPDAKDRTDILHTLTKNGTKPLLLPDVNLDELAQNTQCTGFSGADLAALVREASMASLRERIVSPPQGRADSLAVEAATNGPLGVGLRHFQMAFRKVRPSVSRKDQALYEQIKDYAAKL